ncbi:MAG TPA: GNAT family N-acetyltransferase [Candidatus Kapabacteria bacterium]|nr:GNAT family N-acetyltransferase [Candidatus Kapabacteria bacterium]
MIRELARDDCTEVISLLRATKNFSEPEIAIAEELIDICIEKPEQEDYYAFVAEVNARVAGFLLLGPTPATVGTYDMYWIAAHPEFQGRGIAQELDDFAVRFVKDRGGYLLIAETSSQPGYERTRAFYMKQRYETLATIADYYKPGDDLIIFGKRV